MDLSKRDRDWEELERLKMYCPPKVMGYLTSGGRNPLFIYQS